MRVIQITVFDTGLDETDSFVEVDDKQFQEVKAALEAKKASGQIHTFAINSFNPTAVGDFLMWLQELK